MYFQLLSRTDVKNGWDVLWKIRDAIHCQVGGILQADGEGFSNVGIGGRGLWMRDSVPELWLRLLALHVEDPVESGALGTKIRDQWLLASRGLFTGCVPEGLEDAVSTEERASLVRAAIHSLLGALKAAPPLLRARAEITSHFGASP